MTKTCKAAKLGRELHRLNNRHEDACNQQRNRDFDTLSIQLEAAEKALEGTKAQSIDGALAQLCHANRLAHQIIDFDMPVQELQWRAKAIIRLLYSAVEVIEAEIGADRTELGGYWYMGEETSPWREPGRDAA